MSGLANSRFPAAACPSPTRRSPRTTFSIIASTPPRCASPHALLCSLGATTQIGDVLRLCPSYRDPAYGPALRLDGITQVRPPYDSPLPSCSKATKSGFQKSDLSHHRLGCETGSHPAAEGLHVRATRHVGELLSQSSFLALSVDFAPQRPIRIPEA